MSDLISREDAIEALKRAEALTKAFGYHNVINTIRELPSAQPERKRGEWIAQNIHNCHTDFECSECGYIHNFIHLYGKPTANYTYCPNCGADMRGEKDERTD